MQNTTTITAPASTGIIPDRKAITHLFFGGLIGLLVWEFWADVITKWVIGGPLQPPGLIISLVEHWTGYNLPYDVAEILHYIVGIVGYPLAYFVFSRAVKKWAVILDLGVWAIFTAFLLLNLFKGSFTPFMGLFWLIVTGLSATRLINPNALIADALSWGSFTWFNALGIMAPLAGLPFLLIDGGAPLSFMSYVGHVIYGALAVYVFERLNKGRV